MPIVTTPQGRRFEPTPDDTERSRRLRQARLERGVTQAQLAEAALTSWPNISAYENARTYLSEERFEELLALLAGLTPQPARSEWPKRKMVAVRLNSPGEYEEIANLTTEQRGRALAATKPGRAEPKGGEASAGRGRPRKAGVADFVYVALPDAAAMKRVDALTPTQRGRLLLRAARQT